MNLSTTNKDTIVTSDWHLGNPASVHTDIWSILDSDFKRLVINGDLVDYKYELTDEDSVIIAALQKLQAEGRLICIRGNHEMWSKYKLPLDFIDSYDWEDSGIKLHAEHGHKLLNPWESKTLVELKARKLARKKHYRVIFTAHDHCSELEDRAGIIYVNTGSMMGWNNNVAIVDENLQITLDWVNYKPRVKTASPFARPWEEQHQIWLNRDKIADYC